MQTMTIRIISFFSLFILLGCQAKVQSIEKDNEDADTIVQYALEDFEDEAAALLDSVRYDQVTINNLPLQTDTAAAVKVFSRPRSTDVYVMVDCYPFGDTFLWDFNGNRYYSYKDSLYFTELFFDEPYKDQNFIISLPKLTVTAQTRIEAFKTAYPASYKNSAQHPDIVIARAGERSYCKFRFEYKKGKLWRFAIRM